MVIMTDPITDMLNRIRNAAAVQKPDVTVPYSRFKDEIASILSREGFLGEIKKGKKGKSKSLKIALKYEGGASAITGAKRISKPGQRIYSTVQEIKKVKGGFGTSIISTSKGLMTGEQAKKAKLGGEVLLEIW